MRLPVQARDLRPDLRARHARDALLHGVPEAEGPALPRGRRWRRRAGEGGGAAALRGRRPRRRTRGRLRARHLRRGGLDHVGPASLRRRRPRRLLPGDRRDQRHRRQHLRPRRRGAPGDAGQRGRRAAALQLHPPRDRALGPAGDRDLHRRRLPRARQADEARDRRLLRRAVRPPRGDPQRPSRLGQGHPPHLSGPQGVLRGDRQRRPRSDRADQAGPRGRGPAADRGSARTASPRRSAPRRRFPAVFGHYESFFIASSGASAAFLGLLFVGFTVVDSGESDTRTRERRTVLAGSAFMALADAFFVSILALTGGPVVFALISLTMAAIGLIATSRLMPRAARAGNFARDFPLGN